MNISYSNSTNSNVSRGLNESIISKIANLNQTIQNNNTLQSKTVSNTTLQNNTKVITKNTTLISKNSST